MYQLSDIKLIAKSITNNTIFSGLPIGAYINNQCLIIQPASQCNNLFGENSMLFVATDDSVELPYSVSTSLVESINTNSTTKAPEEVYSKTNLSTELRNAGFSCAAAAISGVGVFGGVLGAPETGGASLLVTVTNWTGFLTGAPLCVNGLLRAGAIAFGHEEIVQWEDQNPIFSSVSQWVNIINLLASIQSVLNDLGRITQILNILRNKGLLQISDEAFLSYDKAKQISLIEDGIKNLNSTEIDELTLQLVPLSNKAPFLMPIAQHTGNLSSVYKIDLLGLATTLAPYFIDGLSSNDSVSYLTDSNVNYKSINIYLIQF